MSNGGTENLLKDIEELKAGMDVKTANKLREKHGSFGENDIKEHHIKMNNIISHLQR